MEEKPKKIGTCLACKRGVYDKGPKVGDKYSYGWIHPDCLAAQRKIVNKWNEGMK